MRIEAARFRVVAFKPEETLARSLLGDALARDTFPGLPRPRAQATITLATSAGDFRARVGSDAPEWGIAVAYPSQQQIVMHGSGEAARDGDPRQILRHELAHLAVHEALGDVPRWFDEGYASYAAGEWGRQEVLATSVGLVWRGLPTLAGLDSGFREGAERAQRSYALAHHAVAELAALGGEGGLSLFLGYWRSQGSFERALRSAYGMSGSDFERHWRSRVRRQFGMLALAADLTALTVVGGIFLGPLWWRRRRRERARLERMRRADAAQEAREREGALAALLGEGPDAPDERRIKGS